MTDRHDDEYDDEYDEEREIPEPPRRTGQDGVRILGAEEAQAAMDAGAVGRRLTEQDTRFGDVPARPDPTLRPAARFPLPADEPLPEVEPRHDDEELPEAIAAGEPLEEPPERVGGAPPLPHWTEPPTGEMPVILPEATPAELPEEGIEAYPGAAAPRFRTGLSDWAGEDYEPIDALGDETTQLGALAAPSEDDDLVFEREVAARRQPRARMAAAVRGGGRGRPGAEEEVPAPEEDLATRLITGVGIAVLGLVSLTLGRDATMLLATAIVGLASLELFQALHGRGFRPATLVAVLGSVAIVPIAFDRGQFAFPFTLVIVTVFTLLWYLLEVVRTRPVVNVAVTITGFVYVGVLGGFAGLLLAYEHGIGLILGVVICAVGYDVVGYFVGSQFGKTRLAPAISPNKTVEGLVGGMVAAIVLAVLVVRNITPWKDLGDALALGITVAVMAPLGDLCESMLKRDLGVKDFGSILPGHGGVLDRFDAILFCLPATFYLALALDVIRL